MTFVPNQASRLGGMPVVLRTVLFWVLMAALAVVLWQISSKNAPSGTPIGYSDFMAQVDKSNIASAKLIESSGTAEVVGQLREPPETFRTVIPKETIPALTEQLRKQGVAIEVSEDKTITWPRLIIDLLPFLAILGAWILMVSKRMRRRSGQNPPPSAAAPTIPTNRPIG